MIESEGIGARPVRFPHRIVSARPARENEGFELRVMSMCVAVSSHFSRAGQADTKTVWEPYRSCTDALPLDCDRCVREKNREKSSVVIRTLPVLH